ncbi:NADP-dependent mannitol dehydrogenase, partial [Pseudocercospora fuligena]
NLIEICQGAFVRQFSPNFGKVATMSDRDNLTSRTLPFMTLSASRQFSIQMESILTKLQNGSEASMTGPPAPLPHYLNAEVSDVSSRDNLSSTYSTLAVTGGAGTLGLSAARALLEHGASGLCLWDLESTLRSSQTSILELAKDFPKTRIFSIGVDVTDSEAITEAVSSVVKTLGSLDHIFCFAGIVGCHHATEMTADQWRKTLDVNTTGSFLCAQAAAKQMQAQKTNGSITLTASISAHRVNYPQPQVGYNVSKAAIVALVKSLAAEWAVFGIRVNSISPGYMDTILNAGLWIEP